MEKRYTIEEAKKFEELKNRKYQLNMGLGNIHSFNICGHKSLELIPYKQIQDAIKELYQKEITKLEIELDRLGIESEE